ncbi:serine/threonine-protein kinase [Streptomyces bicolor]|uniref:serine/threonine-protein kinase n=1 Tax=Streptomyces bicolor TaxID=66874 RepID=UPI0004E160FE|nr:serine/threonine-protein kinase [Streptomyces bicolor]
MSPTDDGVGRVIARRYRLVRRLGAGGMGRVWLAIDLDLACEVVVKEMALPPGVSEQELTARIARVRGEARLAASLRGHPHAVTVHDVFEEDNLPWIVMEYVPGAVDLYELVRAQGPLSRPEVTQIGLGVLDALTAGHRLGILHRDVKPANILVTREPRPTTPGRYRIGRVLLTDYGIALRPDSGEPRLTADSRIIGTPGFLAPERARGSPPSLASDLFSLGATLYFAVVGEGPFDRDTEVSTLTALLFEEPREMHLTGELEPVLRGLLQKDPARRMNGTEAAVLLERLPGDGPAKAPPDTHPPTQRVERPAPSPADRPPPTAPQQDGRGPRSEPVVEPAGEPRPSGKKPTATVIAVTAAAVLIVGGGVWAATALLGGSEDQAEQPTPTGSMPYGDQVELSRALRPGECVSAAWDEGEFKGLPRLALVDCVKEHEEVDAQVVRKDAASSLEDAQQNGPERCESLLRETVDSLADAHPFSLVPSEKGWDRGVHDTACLVFNKTVALEGEVGGYRAVGEEVYLQNISVGDCLNWRKERTYYSAFLADCDAPHDEEVVGFVRAPDGMGFKKAIDEAPVLCSNTYQAEVKSKDYGLDAWYLPEDSWDQGFRYIMCALQRTDKQKLP